MLKAGDKVRCISDISTYQGQTKKLITISKGRIYTIKENLGRHTLSGQLLVSLVGKVPYYEARRFEKLIKAGEQLEFEF